MYVDNKNIRGSLLLFSFGLVFREIKVYIDVGGSMICLYLILGSLGFTLY